LEVGDGEGQGEEVRGQESGDGGAADSAEDNPATAVKKYPSESAMLVAGGRSCFADGCLYLKKS